MISLFSLQVRFPKGRAGFGYEAMIFSRDPVDPTKKPFRFNIAVKLLLPLFNIVKTICEQSGLLTTGGPIPASVTKKTAVAIHDA